VFAKCRINMLIVEHDPLFKTEFLYNDKFIELPYRKNMLTALNVTVPHRVFNEHQTKVRYLLNIGYHNITYKDLVKYMVDNHC
jgi:hypothetical protein